MAKLLLQFKINRMIHTSIFLFLIFRIREKVKQNILFTLVLLCQCPIVQSYECNGKIGSHLGIQTCQGSTVMNWSKRIKFQPEIIFYPKTKSDLIAIVKDAKEKNKKITVIGLGHSYNPLMEGTGYLVSTGYLNKVDVNEVSRTVTVESGATIKQVDKILGQYNFSIPCNIVGTTDITYGGLVATGSHGSGRNCKTMSDYVEEMEIVKADGEVEVINDESYGLDFMNAARVSLGMFGLIYKIKIKVFDDFNIEVVDKQYPLNELFHHLPNLLINNESVEVLWFPFTDFVVVKTWNKSDKEKRESSLFKELGKLLKSYALYYSFHYFIARLLRNNSKEIPAIMRIVGPYIFPNDQFVTDVTSGTHFVNDASDYPIVDTEIAIPVNGTDMTYVEEAWNAMIDTVYENERKGLFPLNIVSHMRFLSGSHSLMSPAYGNERTCHMDFGSYYETPGWSQVVNEVWQTWKNIPGVKLHWPKDMKAYEFIDIYDMYGTENVHAFLKAQQYFDPDGMFVNDFMRDLCGFPDVHREKGLH